MESIRVLCADDSPDMRWLLRSQIEAETDMQCVGVHECADGLVAEAKRLLAGAGGIVVVVLDATMPGASPMGELRRLTAECPGVRTVFYSGNNHPDMVREAMAAGAKAFVSKSEEPEAIVRAIRRVVTSVE